MEPLVDPELEKYAAAHTTSGGALFDELRTYTLDNVPMPQMQVGRLEGGLLAMLVMVSGAKRILEVGTYTGYSALSMARALPDDGQLITLDMDEKATAVAQRFFDQSPHGKKIELKLGRALDSIEALDDEPFDMAFVDADKSAYPAYFDAILPRLRSGGLFVVDNVLWSGAVLDPQDDATRGIVELNRRVQEDDRVDNVLLTVRDGVLVARKR